MNKRILRAAIAALRALPGDKLLYTQVSPSLWRFEGGGCTPVEVQARDLQAAICALYVADVDDTFPTYLPFRWRGLVFVADRQGFLRRTECPVHAAQAELSRAAYAEKKSKKYRVEDDVENRRRAKKLSAKYGVENLHPAWQALLNLAQKPDFDDQIPV